MASIILRTPGAQYGPCIENCDHGDCNLTRKEAARVCPFCAKPIGYENLFYKDGTYGYYHAACIEGYLDGDLSIPHPVCPKCKKPWSKDCWHGGKRYCNTCGVINENDKAGSYLPR